MRAVVIYCLMAFFTVVAVATTLPEYVDRCDPDLASDKSTQCGTDAMFCTGYAFLGRDSDGVAERKLGCRPCEVMPAGAQRDAAVHDPLNVCNCLGGSFCRHTGNADDLNNRVIGYCETSTLIGTPCNTTDQCVGVREETTDGGAARREVGFCVQNRCAQCDPANFASVMGASTHVCPGYTLLSSGLRVYHNSMPGVTVTCSAEGALVMAGEPNFELKAGDAPPEAEPPKSKSGDEKELSHLLGLTIAVLLVLLCVAVLLFVNAGAIIACIVARRREGSHGMMSELGS